MGKGKDKDHRGKGKEKKFRDEEEEEEEEPQRPLGGQSKNAGMLPPSDDESESEEEEAPRKGKAKGQNPNAGMMPPSDDESDEDDESDDDDPPPTPKEMATFIKSKGLGKEFLKWVEKQRKEAKAAPKPMPGYEMSRKEREAAKKKAEEEEDDEEPDPAVAKRLEEVRKRREAQAKQRIAADGWDRMKPLSADNHPPGTVWPPPDQSVDVA